MRGSDDGCVRKSRTLAEVGVKRFVVFIFTARQFSGVFFFAPWSALEFSDAAPMKKKMNIFLSNAAATRHLETNAEFSH